ncbi:TPA: DUF1642 domain-containing protein [Streptococcus agalactiae]|uniref:DUF1642 domain-containing protein n=1 Tax=Streptococcus agalactiae TaxID=1311 RepID=UPI000D6FBB1B|nr:DUF1642 domain-containing protein [Streptococcus agalactiae]PWT25390.1 hypothetical protein CUZ34_01295 [Streptococcus agalactiae]HEN3143874.1 DUF1642 domain-containing protein [Streptococcus agalactiae]
MNIEEAKLGQTVYVKGEIIDIDKDEIFDLEIRTPENDFFVNSEDVFLKLDQPKTVVKKCVAEWYEEKKHAFMYFYVRLIADVYEGRTIGYNQPFIDWVIKTNEAYTILTNMHQFGYEVEKEKLYTVEILNPNRNSKGCAKFRLEKLGDKVYLVKRKSKDVYQNKDSQKLTEAEIRKDFDWAWQQEFMKEVTDADI